MNKDQLIENLKIEMMYSFYDMVIPEYMYRSLAEYVVYHYPVGDFLKAVINNDLVGACATADGSNIKVIPAYINFLYNYAPLKCWGSSKNYQKWIEEK